jgi:hypothetical protein
MTLYGGEGTGRVWGGGVSAQEWDHKQEGGFPNGEGGKSDCMGVCG